MILRSTLFILGLLAFTSCNGDKKQAAKSDVAQTTTAKKESKYSLQSLPQTEMLRLFQEATYIDYIFYSLPFSVSQDNQPSIHANLKLISAEPLDYLPVDCKPIGREFFQISGDIVHEAELYFSEGCYGYVFLKDEKPIYGNKISEEGMKFYSNIINQSMKMSNQ